MVQIRLSHNSGDNKEDKPTVELIVDGDDSVSVVFVICFLNWTYGAIVKDLTRFYCRQVFLSNPEKSGTQSESCVKDGASAVIVPLLVEDRPPPYRQCVEILEETPKNERQQLDPWDLPELQDNSPSWSGG